MKLEEISSVYVIQHLLAEMAKYQVTDTSNMDPVAALDLISKQFDAARRALGIANKLKDPAARQKYKSRTLGAMNSIRAALRRIEKQIQGSDSPALAEGVELMSVILAEIWDHEGTFSGDAAIKEYGFVDIQDDPSPFIFLGIAYASDYANVEEYVADYDEFDHLPEDVQTQIYERSKAVWEELLSSEHVWYNTDSMYNYKQLQQKYANWWEKPNAGELHKKALMQFMQDVKMGEYLYTLDDVEAYATDAAEAAAEYDEFRRAHSVASDNPSLGRRR